MSTLNGATTPTPEGSPIGTPEQFAAIWNGMTEQRRQDWIAAWVNTQRIATNCIIQNHHQLYLEVELGVQAMRRATALEGLIERYSQAIEAAGLPGVAAGILAEVEQIKAES